MTDQPAAPSVAPPHEHECRLDGEHEGDCECWCGATAVKSMNDMPGWKPGVAPGEPTPEEGP